MSEKTRESGYDVRQGPELKAAQRDLQNQFAILLGVDPEQLRGLQLCSECYGTDYQWTDVCMTVEEWIELSQSSQVG